MQSRISFKAVQAFEAAARLSSFALAAEELFVTPSAVSHQIRALEERFGVQLFHRLHRAVVLTDAGRRYAEEIATAFARIEAATLELGRTARSDILTVHSAPSFATQWLMPRLARFSAAHPGIDVRLSASSEAVDLVASAVDLDIRYGSKNIPPAGIIALAFPPETIVPLCARELAEGRHPIRRPGDLSHHTLIHSEGCLVGWHDWGRKHRTAQLDVGRGPRFDRSFMAIGAAVDGLGVCLESLLLAQRELESGRLVAPLGMKGLQIRGYALNVLKSSVDLPKVRAFGDWLFTELANHRPEVG